MLRVRWLFCLPKHISSIKNSFYISLFVAITSLLTHSIIQHM